MFMLLESFLSIYIEEQQESSTVSKCHQRSFLVRVGVMGPHITVPSAITVDCSASPGLLLRTRYLSPHLLGGLAADSSHLSPCLGLAVC